MFNVRKAPFPVLLAAIIRRVLLIIFEIVCFSSGFNRSNINPYEFCTVCPDPIYAPASSFTNIYKHEFLEMSNAESAFPQSIFNTRRTTAVVDFVFVFRKCIFLWISLHFLHFLNIFSIQEGQMDPLILYLKGKTCSAEESRSLA